MQIDERREAWSDPIEVSLSVVLSLGQGFRAQFESKSSVSFHLHTYSYSSHLRLFDDDRQPC